MNQDIFEYLALSNQELCENAVSISMISENQYSTSLLPALINLMVKEYLRVVKARIYSYMYRFDRKNNVSQLGGLCDVGELASNYLNEHLHVLTRINIVVEVMPRIMRHFLQRMSMDPNFEADMMHDILLRCIDFRFCHVDVQMKMIADEVCIAKHSEIISNRALQKTDSSSTQGTNKSIDIRNEESEMITQEEYDRDKKNSERIDSFIKSVNVDMYALRLELYKILSNGTNTYEIQKSPIFNLYQYIAHPNRKKSHVRWMQAYVKRVVSNARFILSIGAQQGKHTVNMEKTKKRVEEKRKLYIAQQQLKKKEGEIKGDDEITSDEAIPIQEEIEEIEDVDDEEQCFPKENDQKYSYDTRSLNKNLLKSLITRITNGESVSLDVDLMTGAKLEVRPLNPLQESQKNVNNAYGGESEEIRQEGNVIYSGLISNASEKILIRWIPTFELMQMILDQEAKIVAITNMIRSSNHGIELFNYKYAPQHLKTPSPHIITNDLSIVDTILIPSKYMQILQNEMKNHLKYLVRGHNPTM